MSTEAVAREFFDRLSCSDLAGALDLVSDDVTWWLAGQPDLLPSAGTYTKERLGAPVRAHDEPAARRHGDDGPQHHHRRRADRAGGVLRRHAGQRPPYHNEYHFAMRVADGKIQDVREYNDTHHAHAVWMQP